LSIEPQTLADAIQNLSSKKKHVLSEDAIRAAGEIEDSKEDAFFGNSSKWWQKRLAIVEEFQESIRLLTAIFQASGFDEFAAFISNPLRVMLVNLCIGVLRGVGFGIGFLIVISLVGYLFVQSLPSDVLLKALGA